MSAKETPTTPAFDARAQAKHLLRVARTVALATLDRTSGAPMATLVALASDGDGAPLLLLSTLAAHTKNLAADPRASLLLTTPFERGDPLNRPRLTVVGALAAHGEPGAKGRFLKRNPKSKLYAGFADFSIFRLEIAAVHFNGGFARAAALTPADILTNLAGAEDLLKAEGELLREINGWSASALSRLAGAVRGDKRRWRAIGLDPDGLDLAAGANAARAAFAAPAKTPGAWLEALEALVTRGAPGPS